MDDYYDRLGDMLRDRLDSDEDPFSTWEPHGGKHREAGNSRERTPPRRHSASTETRAVPSELAEDFRVLGIMPGTAPDECKTAWKRLLMIHHPDRQGGNQAAIEQSTRMAIRINDAYRRIARWYETGRID